MGQSSAWQTLSYRQVEALAATSLNRFVRTDSKKGWHIKKTRQLSVSFSYFTYHPHVFPLFLSLFVVSISLKLSSFFSRTWASFSIRSEYPKRSKSLRHAVMLLPTTWNHENHGFSPLLCGRSVEGWVTLNIKHRSLYSLCVWPISLSSNIAIEIFRWPFFQSDFQLALNIPENSAPPWSWKLETSGAPNWESTWPTGRLKQQPVYWWILMTGETCWWSLPENKLCMSCTRRHLWLTPKSFSPAMIIRQQSWLKKKHQRASRDSRLKSGVNSFEILIQAKFRESILQGKKTPNLQQT